VFSLRLNGAGGGTVGWRSGGGKLTPSCRADFSDIKNQSPCLFFVFFS